MTSLDIIRIALGLVFMALMASEIRKRFAKKRAPICLPLRPLTTASSRKRSQKSRGSIAKSNR